MAARIEIKMITTNKPHPGPSPIPCKIIRSALRRDRGSVDAATCRSLVRNLLGSWDIEEHKILTKMLTPILDRWQQTVFAKLMIKEAESAYKLREEPQDVEEGYTDV